MFAAKKSVNVSLPQLTVRMAENCYGDLLFDFCVFIVAVVKEIIPSSGPIRVINC